MEPTILTPIKPPADTSRIKQIEHYIDSRVMPILKPLQYEILNHRPKDIRQFSRQWLKQYQERAQQTAVTSKQKEQALSDEESTEEFKKKLKQKSNRGPRKKIRGDMPSVSFCSMNQKLIDPPEEGWSSRVKAKLLMYLKKSVLFQHLQTVSLLKVIDSMRCIEFNEGDAVLREGDPGNELFVVDEGTFSCSKQGDFRMKKTYGPGQIFGELALLYGHPRALSISADTNGRLYGLSRKEFTQLIRGSKTESLTDCEQLVGKVDLFMNLNIYERFKLYENMQVLTFGKDQFLIREGEVGVNFYIVAEGQLVAYKEIDKQSKLVYTYKRGDYFGELALLRDIPRQATIKSLTVGKVFFINKDAFNRMLGPLESILRRNEQRYKALTDRLQTGSL